MSKIDLIPLIKKSRNLKPIKECLVQYCGWNNINESSCQLEWRELDGVGIEPPKYFVKTFYENTLGVESGRGPNFKLVEYSYKEYKFSLRKAKSLVLDTSKQLLILDNIIAIDVGQRY